VTKETFIKISEKIYKELKEAYKKHGENNKNLDVLFVSNTILMEEVGEVSKAIVDKVFNNKASYLDIQKELRQVAVMVFEMIHIIDKKKVLGGKSAVYHNKN